MIVEPLILDREDRPAQTSGDTFASGTSIRCSLKIVNAGPPLRSKQRRRLRHVADAAEHVALRRSTMTVPREPHGPGRGGPRENQHDADDCACD